MSDCKSTYSIVKGLWNSYGEYAKATLGVAVSAFGTPAAGVAAVKAADKAEKVVGEAHEFWNENIGKNGWAKLGPRELEFGTKHRGNVIGMTERTFVSSIPCQTEKVRVQLWEKDGKAKTEFKVCLVDGQGHHTQAVQEVLNENGAEKKKERQVIDKTISNTQGKYLVCIIDGKPVIGNFKYALKVSEA